MSPAPLPESRNWKAFREDLLQVAKEGDHDWMEDHEIRSVLNEASRSGLRPELLISCHAAVRGHQAPTGTRKLREQTRILIIDDDAGSRTILKRVLDGAGFQVFTEGSPENFHTVVRDFQPDLLLLDMVMPLVDGLEILHALREEALTRELPVIVLTGLIADSDQTSVNREGVLYLAKPLSAKSLVHCVVQHLGAP